MTTTIVSLPHSKVHQVLSMYYFILLTAARKVDNRHTGDKPNVPGEIPFQNSILCRHGYQTRGPNLGLSEEHSGVLGFSLSTTQILTGRKEPGSEVKALCFSGL